MLPFYEEMVIKKFILLSFLMILANFFYKAFPEKSPPVKEINRNFQEIEKQKDWISRGEFAKFSFVKM